MTRTSPCAGCEQMIDQLEGSRFAGAATAEQDKGFSGLNFQIKFAQEFVAVAETVEDVTEFDGVIRVRGFFNHRGH